MKKACFIIAGLLVLVGAILWPVVGPQLEKDKRTSLSYNAWKLGFGPFQRRFVWMLITDKRGKQEFAGRPLDLFTRRTGLTLVDGDTYAKDSYRGEFLQFIRQTKGPAAKMFWLEGNASQMGCYVLVVDGLVEDIWLAKG